MPDMKDPMDFTRITCANCGIVFCVSKEYEQFRRKDHKAFHCPNGHSNIYPEKKEDNPKDCESLKVANMRLLRQIETLEAQLSEKQEKKGVFSLFERKGEE